MLVAEPTRNCNMTAGDGRPSTRGGDPGSASAVERQAREARQDAERYARRGNKAMYAISLQAAQELEAAAAAHRAQPPKDRR
ncbi:hypothetical protein KXR53_24305 [Inquilinus limosus]|uniref:hypothetical protein n=1 Tax=Inquilinus limosus TaxID=171674 RepID=UPI003F160846